MTHLEYHFASHKLHPTTLVKQLPNVRLVFKSFQTDLLLETITAFRNYLNQNNLTTKSANTHCVYLPRKIKRFCILRSPHIDKDAREHLEIRVSKILIDLPYEILENLELLFCFRIPASITITLELIN